MPGFVVLYSELSKSVHHVDLNRRKHVQGIGAEATPMATMCKKKKKGLTALPVEYLMRWEKPQGEYEGKRGQKEKKESE